MKRFLTFNFTLSYIYIHINRVHAVIINNPPVTTDIHVSHARRGKLIVSYCSFVINTTSKARGTISVQKMGGKEE